MFVGESRLCLWHLPFLNPLRAQFLQPEGILVLANFARNFFFSHDEDCSLNCNDYPTVIEVINYGVNVASKLRLSIKDLKARPVDKNFCV